MRISKEAGTGDAWAYIARRLIAPLFATDKPRRNGCLWTLKYAFWANAHFYALSFKNLEENQ